MITGIGLFKMIQDITVSDVKHLVDNNIEEWQELEYKEKGYENKDKYELLKDITCMSNGGGGYIMIGIKEQENKASCFVNVIDIDIIEQRIYDMCLAGIEPRMYGLKCQQLIVDEVNILMVFVPPCADKLYAVTCDGKVEFWKRYNKRKDRMRPEEIRREFILNRERYANSIAILNEQIEKQRLGKYNVKTPAIYITAIPLNAEEECIDVLNIKLKDFLATPYVKRQGGAKLLFLKRPEHYLYGIKAINVDEIGNETDAFEVRRNGLLTIRFSLWTENDGKKEILFGWLLAEYIFIILQACKDIYSMSNITDRVIVTLTLSGLSKVAVSEHDTRYNGFIPTNTIESKLDTFNLGLFEIENYYQFDTLAGTLVNRLWNAIGKEKSPFVNEQNQIVIK